MDDRTYKILRYVAIACAVLVFYCVTGGILASVYTDLVQGAVMIVPRCSSSSRRCTPSTVG